MDTFTARRSIRCAAALLAGVCLTAAADEGGYAPSLDPHPALPTSAPRVTSHPYASPDRLREGVPANGPGREGALPGRLAVERVAGDGATSGVDGANPERIARAPRFVDRTALLPLLGAAHERTAPLQPSPPVSTAYGPWLDGDGPSANARQLLAQLERIDSHGLRAADYDLAGLRSALAALSGDEPPRIAPSDAYAARAALDARFDAAFTALATDLGRGAVDARTVQSRWFRDRPEPDAAALRDALGRGGADVDAALASVAVRHPHYARLRERMRELLDERARGAARVSIGGDGALLPGQRHRDIMGIKARLIEAGELERRTVLTPMFDADLALAVDRFQKRHGIEPATRIGPRTREALARTVEQDIDEVALSLERWRWLPREFGSRHVFVNLPDYRLQLIEDERTLVEMPIVVGARRFPTPSFSRAMSYLEFNPTWTVPASIANRELIPRERREPGYLASRQFDFLKLVDGRLERVPRETVTPEDFETMPFPYTLRQRGGPINALGRMKFMMPNPYAIYLHDTPTKRHFALHERAYSHGCVRLSDPDRLADVLMRKDGMSERDIGRVLANPLTNRVRLRTHVPTHLVYLTAWVDESGRVQRRPDVYGHDPALREALRDRGLLPSAWRPAPANGRDRRGSTVSGLVAPLSATSGPAAPG